MSNDQTKPLQSALTEALAAWGRDLGTPLRLAEDGSVTLSFGAPITPVTVEWVDAGSCVAIHAPFPTPKGVDPDGMGRMLIRTHTAGAATLGCAFWRMPDGAFRVGLTLVGPALGKDELVEAATRVAAVATAPENRARRMRERQES